MTTLKQAILINGQGCQFDKIDLTNLKDIKEWAKGRGGAYVLDVINGLDKSVQFSVRHNRFYKLPN